jgi:hypothetical protein
MTQQSTLRGLAKAYATGILEKDKYRKDRTSYIEAVLSGAVAIHPAETPVQAKLERTGEIPIDRINRAVTTDVIDINITPEPGPLKANLGLIIGGVAALLVMVIIVMFATSGDDNASATPQEQSSVVAPPVMDTPRTAAQNLIASFLAKNSWSEAAMVAFLTEWEVMPEPEKTSIGNTIELGQLANEIYKKLLEERALSGIGNPETSRAKQQQLVEFAANIGINDPRISLPDQPATSGAVENL